METEIHSVQGAEGQEHKLKLEREKERVLEGEMVKVYYNIREDSTMKLTKYCLQMQ
jgi:hypothetical protein